MKVALITVSIDRETGEVIKEVAGGIEQINEDEFYRPLIEVFGNGFIKQWREELK